MARRAPDPLFLLGLGIALAVGGALLWLRLDRDGPSNAAEDRPALIQAVVAELEASDIQQVLGDPGAPVEVVEITDYQCPGCRTIHEWAWPVLRPSVEAGTVRLRVLPVALPGNESAVEAALYAACVQETEAAIYPGYLLLLFSAQERWAHDDSPSSALGRLVADAGGTSDAVEGCVRSRDELRSRLEGAYARAAAAGLEWVPQLVVDGRVVRGVSEEELRTRLRDAIETAR